MRVLIINKMAPGDILMLTAAVRDLKKAHPEFEIGVDTTAMDFWLNNPYINRDVTAANADRIIQADYPLYKENNRLPYHFIHGFRKFLEEALEVDIPQGDFKVDIHLTEEEKDPENIRRLFGIDPDETEYWLVNAGWKDDFTIKRWPSHRWQFVLRDTADEVNWVQIGSTTAHQPSLEGVTNLVGKTTLRTLCQLMFHASGVLTGVSMPMHLATMDMVGGGKRPCVVVAGGREPSTWEAYPTHQFIHNCGCYPCNRDGGCWMSRVVKVGDGKNRFNDRLCKWPRCTRDGQWVARCMDDISSSEVVLAVHKYFQKDW